MHKHGAMVCAMSCVLLYTAACVDPRTPPKRAKIEHGLSKTAKENAMIANALAAREREMQVRIDVPENMVHVSGYMVWAPEINRALIAMGFIENPGQGRYPMVAPLGPVESAMQSATRNQALTMAGANASIIFRDYLIALFMNAVVMCSDEDKRGTIEQRTAVPGMIAVDDWRITITPQMITLQGDLFT